MNDVVTVLEHYSFEESPCDCCTGQAEITYELPDGSLHDSIQSVYVQLLKDRGVSVDVITVVVPLEE